MRRIGQSVEIFAEPSVGRHIRRRGEDQTAGSVLLSTGHRLRSVDIGVCAAAGVADVSVAQRPRVAILSNGDELVNAGVMPEPYQVTDVNSPMLAAAVLEAGGIPVVIGCVGDKRRAVEHALETAAATADFIVSTAASA
jgi:molybdopterin molybdotransferase